MKDKKGSTLNQLHSTASRMSLTLTMKFLFCLVGIISVSIIGADDCESCGDDGICCGEDTCREGRCCEPCGDEGKCCDRPELCCHHHNVFICVNSSLIDICDKTGGKQHIQAPSKLFYPTNMDENLEAGLP